MALSLSVSEKTRRTVFLDKMRYTMVLGVVIQHAACAYASIIPWWAVIDNDARPFFDLLIIVLDIYQMPVLFFIAGYFALPSLHRHGTAGFVAAKLKRLGLPLLCVGIFFLPTIPYIRYALRTEDPMRFIAYWWMQLPTALDWHWIHFTSPRIAVRHVHDFSPWHLWFISLLLIFFLLMAAWFKCFPNQSAKIAESSSDETPPMLSRIIFFGIVSAAAMTLVHRFSPGWAWARMGGFILIQPTRIPIYAGFFLLGLYSFTRGWFTRHPLPGSPWIWLASSLTSTLALLAIMKTIGYHPAPIPWDMAAAHSALRLTAALSVLGLLLSAGQRWWQRPTAFWRHMHPVSYDIYLIHLPLAVIFQLAALYLPLPVGVKFALISIVTVALSWAVGKTIVKPHPIRAIGLLLTVFGITAIIIR